MRRFILGAGLLAIAMSISAQDPDIPAKPVCYTTHVGANCCDDHVLSWTQCGEPPTQCNTQEEYCDHLLSTQSSDTGHTGIENAPCLKHTIHRECQDGSCVYVADDPNTPTIVMGTRESGGTCIAVPK
jgi:hypothetical protein